MPTLVLLRHAKSSYPEGVDDHDRPLSERGNREAPVAGRRMAESLRSIPRPRDGFDVALVSTATRAQQTWAHVAAEVGAEHVVIHEDLYLADKEDIERLVRDVPGSCDAALVVGHNEGLEEAASSLSGSSVSLKTSTYAVLTCPDVWASWGPACAHLVEVVVAR